MKNNDTADDKPAPWWDSIDLGFILLLLVIPLTAYGCEMASDVSARRATWKSCVEAKELTEQCRLVLQAK